MAVTHMANQELLPLVRSEAGLWLAAVAACAGLALGWRWWAARRSLRNRALQVLGFEKPSTMVPWSGLRYAGLATVAILTVLALAPAAPGVSDAEPAPQGAPAMVPDVTPVLVVVELHTDGATIMVHGDTVEIRLLPGQSAAVTSPTGARQGDDDEAVAIVVTPTAELMPDGME
jgi:hypothetical protein